MVLRGVMAAQANGPCQLAAQVGQGCGRLVDQGGQTCPLLVLGQSPRRLSRAAMAMALAIIRAG